MCWAGKKLSDVRKHSLLFPVSSHQSTTLHMSPYSLCPVKDAAFDGDSRKHPTNGLPGTCKKKQILICMQNLINYDHVIFKYYYIIYRMTLTNFKIYHKLLHLSVL